MSPFDHVGTPTLRPDALEKALGRARFAVDAKLPGMLVGRILRSPHAHARIRAVDPRAAEAVPGVKAVLTGSDVEGRYGNFGVAIADQSVVAVDKVRFVGDPVAAVAAVDASAAEEALAALRVEYEELPPLLTLDAALAPGAPLVHETIPVIPALRELLDPAEGTNVCTHFALRHGDVDEGFRLAEVVVEDTFTTEPVQHATLEPHCALARVLPGPRLEVVTNNQDPSNLRSQLSQVFGVPQASIEVTVPYVGGGFGAKIGPKLEPLAVALAWKAGFPVKLVLNREEDFLTVSRHGSRVRVRTGARRDGTLVAREVTVHFDKGAYADVGPVVSKNTGFSAAGPYRIPHVRVDAYNVYTNKVPAGAMRGFGLPQVTWACEQQLDVLAERLGMDCLALRRRNLLESGETFHTGEPVEDVALAGLLDRAAEAIGWEGRDPSAGGNLLLRGKGLALGFKGTATPSVSGATVRMDPDGSVTLHCNTVEMGQGIRTVFQQLVAEELGVPPARIRVAEPGAHASFDTGTYSSRSTFHMGNALLLAVADLREQLFDAAAALLDAPSDALVLAGERIRRRDDPERAVSLAQAVRGAGAPGGDLLGRGRYETAGGVRPKTGQGVASRYWMSAAAGAEVEVDRETGAVRVLRYAGSVDPGRAMNPANVEQQAIGSLVMGLGQAFTERMLYDQAGRLRNPSFVDYKIPTARDLPEEIVSLAVPTPHRGGPYGAKGIGEVMILPVLPALGNALYRATGCRFKDLPITPEKVLGKLLERAERGRRDESGAHA